MPQALSLLLALLMALLPSAGWSHSRPQGSNEPLGNAGDAAFGLQGSTVTDAALPLIRATRGPASLDRTGGWVTYYFSEGAGGKYPDGSATGAGTPTDPMDQTLLDDYFGIPGVKLVLDEGETFVFQGTMTSSISSTSCPNVSEPCTALVTDGDVPATITTLGTAATNGPIFQFDDSTGGGWAVVANVRIVSNEADTDLAAEGDNMDAFSANSGAGHTPKIAIFGAHVTLTGDGSDNCWAPHRDAEFAVFGSSCVVTAASTGSNQGWAPNHGSANVSIGVDVVDLSTTGTSAVAFTTNSVAGGLDVLWVDGIAEMRGATNLDNVIVIDDPLNSETVNVTLAKVGIKSNAGGVTSRCLSFNNMSSTETMNLTLRQVSATGCWIGLHNSTIATTNTLTIDGEGFTCDDVQDNCIEFADADWATALTNLRLVDWIYDQQDSANVFRCVGCATVDTDTATAFSAELIASGSGTISILDGDIDSNGGDVQWSDGTLTAAQLNCNPANECWKAYDREYTLAIPTLRGESGLPAWMLGNVVTQIKLNGTDGNIGR